MDDIALSRVAGISGTNKPNSRYFINPATIQKIKAKRKVAPDQKVDGKFFGGNTMKFKYADYKGGTKLEDMYNVLQVVPPKFDWQGGKCCACIEGQRGRPVPKADVVHEINTAFKSPYGANCVGLNCRAGNGGG